MKKIISILLAFTLMLSCVACSSAEPESSSSKAESSNNETDSEEESIPDESSDEEEESEDDGNEDVQEVYDDDTTWAIYWYLCGSDLESGNGAATTDLYEMMEVYLPENVTVVIQTGGSNAWQNDFVNPNASQRFVYDCNGMNLAEENEVVNMGDPNTLADFVKFSSENYPADREMLLFWNHGGGSVDGAAYDEQFGHDSLTLDEMYSAITTVYEDNEEEQPIDIIGFDTCLMATMETAFIFSGLGEYLVASEQLEPGNGWLYSGWLQALADNPALPTTELCAAICDTYVEGCEMVGTEADITLSVTNLSKIYPVVDAYEEFGDELLKQAMEDSSFIAKFSQHNSYLENYGGNTREQGYTNMIDLGDLASNVYDIIPEASDKLMNAIADCIEYKINGMYRDYSQGLSTYYPLDGSKEKLSEFDDISRVVSMSYFFEYALNGTLSEDGMNYIYDMEYDEVPELVTLSNSGWDDVALTVDDEGRATMDLGTDAGNVLESVTFDMYYVNEEDNTMINLGTDNDIISDWENGVFKDNFRGVWGSIDGALCYMEIIYEGDDFNRYSIPVFINGEKYNLMVLYDYNTAQYYIEYATKPISENGAADKNGITLKEGDTVEFVRYYADLDSDSAELESVIVDSITVTADTCFSEVSLPDGRYLMMFCMSDMQGYTAYSQVATVFMENGEMSTSVD